MEKAMTKAEVAVKAVNELRSTIISNGNAIEYEDRIPVATQENLQEVGKALFSYQVGLNEFVNTLINQIGKIYINRKVFNNKLRELKRGMLEYGDTIEEVWVDIVKANTYTPIPKTGEENDVFKVSKPEVLSAFHKVNREDVYPITVNETMLKRAFRSPNQFYDFTEQIFTSLYNSDTIDEYILFRQLVGNALKNSKAIKVVKPTDKETAENFSVVMREYGLKLDYPSREYNQAGVANVTSINEQILFLRADIVPIIDVKQLANNFNENLGKPLSKRIIVLDNFGSGNDSIIGGIIDKDFSMIHDTLFDTTSIYNPLHRYWNYFLHHHQVISNSPFANAVCFTTEEIPFLIKSIEVIPVSQTVRKGYATQVHTILEFQGDGDTTYKYTITGGTSNATRITDDGTVYVGNDETASTLTITATTNAKFTSGSEQKPLTATATITVIN